MYNLTAYSIMIYLTKFYFMNHSFFGIFLFRDLILYYYKKVFVYQFIIQTSLIPKTKLKSLLTLFFIVLAHLKFIRCNNFNIL